MTNDPPSGTAVDSICQTGNLTCVGTPEIWSFFNRTFNRTSYHDYDFKNLVFSRETVAYLFTPYEGTFLNIGKLKSLFEIGAFFDINRNSLYLDHLQIMTRAETKENAIVYWEYAKYFTKEFVLM